MEVDSNGQLYHGGRLLRSFFIFQGSQKNQILKMKMILKTKKSLIKFEIVFLMTKKSWMNFWFDHWQSSCCSGMFPFQTSAYAFCKLALTPTFFRSETKLRLRIYLKQAYNLSDKRIESYANDGSSDQSKAKPCVRKTGPCFEPMEVIQYLNHYNRNRIPKIRFGV